MFTRKFALLISADGLPTERYEREERCFADAEIWAYNWYMGKYGLDPYETKLNIRLERLDA